jgi:multidrug efflux pump subunit AcrB
MTFLKNIITPFRVVLLFLVFILFVGFIVSKLKISLTPPSNGFIISITYEISNSTPLETEQLATSVLENSLSTIEGIKKQISKSYYSSGVIQLKFPVGTNIDQKKIEIALLLRRVYPQLPNNCSYPQINVSTIENEQFQKPFLIYSFSAGQQPFQIKNIVESKIKEKIVGVSGIKDIVVLGVPNLQLALNFNKDKCKMLKIVPSSIVQLIYKRLSISYLGSIENDNGTYYFIHTAVDKIDVNSIQNFSFFVNGKFIKISDIADLRIEEQEPQGYFRINGKNLITLSFIPKENSNIIFVGNNIKNLISEYSKKLPKDYETKLIYDDTEYLKTELVKNYERLGLSILIIVIFLTCAYRNWRFNLILILSLVVTFSITIVLAYLFSINIHLFSLAGLAISFGIISDYSIVMLDSYHQTKSIKIFPALIASVFIVISSLLVVFLLPEKDQNNLNDFAVIIILSLTASLLVSSWFIPSIYNLVISDKIIVKEHLLSQKKAFRINIFCFKVYKKILQFFVRFRISFYFFLLLFIGVPIFMLPERIEGFDWYNKTVGSEYYKENLKSTIDKFTGGTFRYFTNNLYNNAGYREPEKTRILVNAKLPFGSSVKQLNDVLQSLEEKLKNVKGIDSYVTNIYNGQNGTLSINFKNGYDIGTLPLKLKEQIAMRSIDQGGVTWSIQGVGQSFGNGGIYNIPSYKILLKGYRYGDLSKFANTLAQKLHIHGRIQNINIDEVLDYNQGNGKEYLFHFEKQSVVYANLSAQQILNNLKIVSKPLFQEKSIYINGKKFPIMFQEKSSSDFTKYDMLNMNMEGDGTNAVKLKYIGDLSMTNTLNSINKEDREYIRAVSYEYLGSQIIGDEITKKTVNEINAILPLGFRAESDLKEGDWGIDNKYYQVLFLICAVIYCICSALFENLKQPVYIICMLPISFIGIFLIFSFSDFYFDQGGFACFIMLSGLVTNSSILLVNEFNSLKHSGIENNRAIIRAIANRGRTISLITAATCCSIIPFLFEGQKEVFWFSFSLGTLGGLIFSFFAVFFVLPTLLWKKYF